MGNIIGIIDRQCTRTRRNLICKYCFEYKDRNILIFANEFNKCWKFIKFIR